MKMKLLLLSGFALSLSGLSLSTLAEDEQASNVFSQFVNQALHEGIAEIKFGELAAKRGQLEKVRELGQMLVTDYGTANAKLREIAAMHKGELLALGSRGPLPTPVVVILNDGIKLRLNRLLKRQGAAFDKAFVLDTIEYEDYSLRMFTQEAETGGHASLRAFAAEMAAVSQRHLDAAKAIQTALKIEAPAEETEN